MLHVHYCPWAVGVGLMDCRVMAWHAIEPMLPNRTRSVLL